MDNIHYEIIERCIVKKNPQTNLRMEDIEESTHILRDEDNFIQNVSQFFNQEDLSDALLVVGENKFFVHKFVLAKSSDVFRTMMYDKRYNHETHHEYELNETPECQEVFELFLRFMYTAEIGITVDSAVGILCLADKYCVESLKTLCSQYMTENARPPKLQNSLRWYSWSKMLCLEDLFNQCAKTIAWNVNSLIYMPEWLNLTTEFVQDILSRADLVVRNEYALYTALCRWLLDPQRVDDLKQNVKLLLPLIRFPQMYVNELFAIESSDFFKKPECDTVLESLVGKAHRFRSLCPSQKDLDVEFTEDFYLSRNYVDLVVDTVKLHNTLRFGIQVDVKMFVGPVPSQKREGEWKITYRKSSDNWTLQFFCHESALVDGEARVSISIILINEEETVIQVVDQTVFVVTRANHAQLTITLDEPEEAKQMMVMIKPLQHPSCS